MDYNKKIMLKAAIFAPITIFLVLHFMDLTFAEKPSKTLSDKEIEVLDALESEEGPVIITTYSVLLK